MSELVIEYCFPSLKQEANQSVAKHISL